MKFLTVTKKTILSILKIQTISLVKVIMEEIKLIITNQIVINRLAKPLAIAKTQKKSLRKVIRINWSISLMAQLMIISLMAQLMIMMITVMNFRMKTDQKKPMIISKGNLRNPKKKILEKRVRVGWKKRSSIINRFYNRRWKS